MGGYEDPGACLPLAQMCMHQIATAHQTYSCVIITTRSWLSQRAKKTNCKEESQTIVLQAMLAFGV